MKKSRRIVSLLLSLSLALAIMVFPVSAIDTTEFDNSDPLIAALLASEDCEVRYVRNGTVRIIVATLGEDELPTLTRASNPYIVYGTAYWNNPSEESFQCRVGWGTTCSIRTFNQDTENNLRVQYDYEIDGVPLSLSQTAVPGESVFTSIDSPTGEDLTCLIEATMTPERGTTGLSADWMLRAQQNY